MRRLFVLMLAGLVALPLSAASVDGMDIHSSSAGAGTTIVFVHGWTCDGSSWAGQVPAFAKDHRVITLDLPGHGRSESPHDGKLSMDVFARAVEAVRAEANAERIVLVGHSMGAPVIRQYAHMYPQRVAGLVAVDGPLDVRAFGELPPGFPPPLTGPEGLAAREGMIRSMFIPGDAGAAPAADSRDDAGRTRGDGSGRDERGVRSCDSLDRRHRRAGASVYAGTANVPDPAATKELYPNHEAMQMAGTGHFLMMEKPAEFNRVLSGVSRQDRLLSERGRRASSTRASSPRREAELGMGVPSLSSAAWQTAERTGALALMEYVNVQRLADTYMLQALASDNLKEALATVNYAASLFLATDDPFTLPPAARDAVRSRLLELRAQLQLDEQLGRQLLESYVSYERP